MKASELLLQSAEPFDKACLMVREMELEIERLRAALQLSTNGLRHCSRWNISEETENALITQVIANDALLISYNYNKLLSAASETTITHNHQNYT